MNFGVALRDGSTVAYEDGSEQVRIDSSVKARRYRWHTLELSADGALLVYEQTILIDHYYGQGVLEEMTVPVRLYEAEEWNAITAL